MIRSEFQMMKSLWKMPVKQASVLVEAVEGIWVLCDAEIHEMGMMGPPQSDSGPGWISEQVDGRFFGQFCVN